MRAFAIAFVGLVLGQPGNVLNGTWTANFQGTTYVRLALAEGATVPQGTMTIGQTIHVDDDGNVDSVTAISRAPTRMFDVRWSNGVLSFGVNDGPDVDRFEFRMIDANHAELAMILSEEERRQLAADQMPLPKPFPLTKTP
jgi:hypothetical protein